MKVLTACLCIALFSIAADRPASPQPSVSVVALSQRVWALRLMHELDLRPDQIEQLGVLARETAPPADDAAKFSSASRKYVAALQAYYAALLKGEDQDRLTELREEVQSIEEDDHVNIDDSVAVTAAARGKAEEFVRTLRPGQVAGYLALYEDETPNPVETLMTAAAKIRGESDAAADESINQTVEEVRVLIGGLNVEKSLDIADKAKEWLTRARAFSNTDFAAQRVELEKSAAQLCAVADGFTILRHWIERDVAELLSNPQLAMAVEAKSGKVSK